MGRHSTKSRESLPEVGQDTLLKDFEQETRGRRKQSKLRRRVRAGAAIAGALLAYNVASSLASDSPNSNTVAVEAPADSNDSGSNAGGSNEKAPSASASPDTLSCDISNVAAYASGTESVRVELELKNTGKTPATYVVSEYNKGKDGADGTFGDPFNAEGTDPSKTAFEMPSQLIGQEVVVYAAVESQGATDTELCGTIAVQGEVANPTVDFVTDNTVPNPMPR